MKRIFCSHNPMLVAQLKGLLEGNGIACFTRNDYLQGGAGELPPTECWPELWVVEDTQAARADALVVAHQPSPNESRAGWACPRCSESLEGQFNQCWNCGYERPVWELEQT